MPAFPVCLILTAVVTSLSAMDPPPAPPTWRASIDQARDRLASHLFGLKVSAFGDITAAPDAQGRKKLDWGALEADLSGEFFDIMETALAVTTSAEGTRIAVGFLDFHPFGGTISPRGRLWVEKGFHIQVGRFDVPFGNDWQFFASKDSVSISRPMTTDGIMDGGYNDVGLRVLGNDGTLNFNTFILRGFGDGRLAGGRLGFTPFGNPFSLKETRSSKVAEFGLSYLYDTDANRRKREVAWAGDVETHLGHWCLRAEYLNRRQEPTSEEGPITRRGWQLTQEYAWPDLAAPTTLFLRYERIAQNPVSSPDDAYDARTAAGLSITLAGIFQLKAEWQDVLKATASTRESAAYSPNVWLAQLVVVF